jgi:uncharacterized protein
VILVDSNIPMYLIGADGRHKDQSRRLLERAVRDGVSLVTDAEVFQEILHRYASIDRRDAIQPAFDVLRRVVDAIYPIEFADVERSRRILASKPRLSARDSLHVAVMQARDIGRIMSFDTGFDGLPGIERVAG